MNIKKSNHLEKYFNFIIFVILLLIISCNNQNDSLKVKVLTHQDSIQISREYYSLSVKLHNQNKNEESLHSLNSSIEYDNMNISAYYNRISLYYFTLRNYDKAIIECDNYIKRFPNDQDIYFISYIKASILSKSNKDLEAIIWYNKAVKNIDIIYDSLEVAIIYYDRYKCRKKLRDGDAYKDSVIAKNYGYWNEQKFDNGTVKL